MKEPPGPTSIEGVYEKYRAHHERLREMQDRAGDAFTDLALVQLMTTSGFVEDLGRVIYGTNGHGRILHPDKQERQSA